MKKIKNIFYSAALLVALSPVLVSAQGFSVPEPEGTTSRSLTEVLTGLMNILLSFVGILGVIGFAISGIMYLTAAGDEGRVENAKKTMIWSITGVVVALVGVVVVRAIDAWLQGQSV
jgi:Trk-type K+ transport system membrane component